MWLPRCEAISKPNPRMMPTSSGPDRRLSRGRVRLHLKGHENRGRRNQSKCSKVFTFQMCCHSFFEVSRDLVQRLPLSYNGYFQTFSDIARLLAFPNDGLYRML